jgi:hypothetical protein
MQQAPANTAFNNAFPDPNYMNLVQQQQQQAAMGLKMALQQ